MREISRPMTHNRKMLVYLLSSLVLCARTNGAATDSSAGPYQGIVERNVFGLKAPPPPADPEPVKPPPPKLILNGITTMGGKRALLSTPPVPGKTPAEARAQYYTLAEGQRDGDLEVLEVNERARTVKVSYGGTVETLDFKENGVKSASGPQLGAIGTLPAKANQLPLSRTGGDDARGPLAAGNSATEPAQTDHSRRFRNFKTALAP